MADARRGASLSPRVRNSKQAKKKSGTLVRHNTETLDFARPSPTRSTTPAGHFHVRQEDKIRGECIKKRGDDRGGQSGPVGNQVFNLMEF